MPEPEAHREIGDRPSVAFGEDGAVHSTQPSLALIGSQAHAQTVLEGALQCPLAGPEGAADRGDRYQLIGDCMQNIERARDQTTPRRRGERFAGPSSIGRAQYCQEIMQDIIDRDGNDGRWPRAAKRGRLCKAQSS